MSSDKFYLEGIRIMEASRDVDLLEGKLMREHLKKELFAALYANE
jgi:hypothetical protein